MIMRGYLSLLTIIVITGVTVSLAFSRLFLGSDAADSGRVRESMYEARAYADACAETALLAIVETDAYEGSDTLSFDQGTCGYTVAISSSTGRSLRSTGYAGTSVQRALLDIRIATSSSEAGTTTTVTRALWTEPSSF
ncbi:MAG: hypothetical protein ABA06_00080 [Parcubacteria bacterium C7867-001]|nr:MAG: hypothetical protein ABA06_00080 [Parcubacteria bacterium C7867-001]